MVAPLNEKYDGTKKIGQTKTTNIAGTTTTMSDGRNKNGMAIPDAQTKSSVKKKNSSTFISESNDIRKSEDSVNMRRLRARKAKRIRTLEQTDTSLISRKRELNLKEFIRRHLKLGAVKMNYEVWELELLLKAAHKSFQQGSSLAEFNAPVNICGDIHGQYSDLIRIFQACGLPFQKRYLFLGDYVDRGRHSLEVIVLLFACKVQFPKHIILLRGNHEVEKINRQYGFQAEMLSRFKNPNEGIRLYHEFNEVFSEMPLAALVSGKILCMHGGISPDLNTLDDIRQIKRPINLLKSGLVQDLLWADPDIETKGFRRNYIRCVSVMFGEDAVHAKLKKLGIQMVIRAHQVVEFGYAFFAGKKLITVFSAARYYEDVCNWGAVVTVNADLEISFSVFKPEEYKQSKEKFLDTADEDDDAQNQL